MQVRISDVLAEEQTYRGTAPGVILDLAGDESVRAEGPVTYDLHAVVAVDVLIVRGTLEAALGFRCSRCDEWFSSRVVVPKFESDRRIVSPGVPGGELVERGGHREGRGAGRRRPREAVVQDEDPLPVVEGEFADLTEDIRESIILALPGFPVCDPGCRGLCPKCGINRNRAACTCREEPETQWTALNGLKLE